MHRQGQFHSYSTDYLEAGAVTPHAVSDHTEYQNQGQEQNYITNTFLKMSEDVKVLIGETLFLDSSSDHVSGLWRRELGIELMLKTVVSQADGLTNSNVPESPVEDAEYLVNEDKSAKPDEDNVKAKDEMEVMWAGHKKRQRGANDS
ncbi:uncharacterized protein LOC144027147 [Festucalex cinctus]